MRLCLVPLLHDSLSILLRYAIIHLALMYIDEFVACILTEWHHFVIIVCFGMISLIFFHAIIHLFGYSIIPFHLFIFIQHILIFFFLSQFSDNLFTLYTSLTIIICGFIYALKVYKTRSSLSAFSRCAFLLFRFNLFYTDN